MILGIYAVLVEGEERGRIGGNFAEASSPIYIAGEEGELQATPFQVADARHSPLRAAELVDEWLEGQCGEPWILCGETFEVSAVEA